ncbi:MAG: enoyl-CoA hydratase [Thiothrix nivea]|nr:MAG: enoyl-CoA hydratase [Thiothrix nivea]
MGAGYKTVIFEAVDVGEKGIYRLILNRPQQLNALNETMLDEIAAVAARLESTADARVLLVTGAGEKAFAAGADIAGMVDSGMHEGLLFGRKGQRAFRRLETLPFPVIAVVNGYALGGGCELAMSCDWILAADNAQFGQPEVALGVTPGFGGTQRLPRLIGRNRALELLTTGARIDAQTACDWGLVNRVYPADELMDAALRMAQKITRQAPLAVEWCKQAVYRGEGQELETACVLEEQMFGLCFATEDQKEGMAAFVEKRKPQFKGC